MRSVVGTVDMTAQVAVSEREAVGWAPILCSNVWTCEEQIALSTCYTPDASVTNVLLSLLKRRATLPRYAPNGTVCDIGAL